MDKPLSRRRRSPVAGRRFRKLHLTLFAFRSPKKTPTSLPRPKRYYRDRMNVPRGPCTMPVLREAWIHGVVDEHTLVWGKGLMDWLPARNVRALVPQIRTVEVQLATWGKRNLVLGPALRAVRKQRKNERPEEPTEQLGEYFLFSFSF